MARKSEATWRYSPTASLLCVCVIYAGATVPVCAQTPLSFPGCTFLQDSEIATNPDYGLYYNAIQQVGIGAILSNLKVPATLFLLNNKAIADDVATHNITAAEFQALPNSTHLQALEYHVVPGHAFLTVNDFKDGEVLTTLDPAANLTVYVDETNSTKGVVIESYGSEVVINTPPFYACNLVMYGIDDPLQPPQAAPFDNSLLGSRFLQYLEYLVMPGGAEVPAQLLVNAVAAGQTDTVARAFVEALQAGYTQQLVHILQRAVTIPGGFEALAAVANEMISESSCSTLSPLIQALNAILPTIARLGSNPAQLLQVQQDDPRLASCILSSLQA